MYSTFSKAVKLKNKYLYIVIFYKIKNLQIVNYL